MPSFFGCDFDLIVIIAITFYLQQRMTFDPTIAIGQLAAELSRHICFQDGGISSAVARRPRDASCLSVTHQVTHQVRSHLSPAVGC